MVDGVDNVVRAGEPVVVPVNLGPEREVGEVPEVVGREPGVDASRLRIVGQWTLMLLGEFKFVRPSRDGGEVVIPEDPDHGLPGGRLKHLAGQLAYGFMPFPAVAEGGERGCEGQEQEQDGAVHYWGASS